MATFPATNVSTVDAPPAISAPLDGTRLLVAAESFRGALGPVAIRQRDLSRYLERTGAGIPAFDAVDVALREGVPEVIFSRIVGPGAAFASLPLAGGTGTSLTLTAREPGEWANGAAGGLSAEVVNGPAGATERVVILRRNDVEVERTTAATTRADLQAAVNRMTLVSATLGPDTGLPTVAADANFTGGLADGGAITTTQVREALDRVTPDLGPMQVVTPGRSTDASNTELLDYARDSRDRTALLEIADGLAASAIAASGAALRALGAGAEGAPRHGGAWAQNATGPGLVPGSTRSVPWAIVQAGLIARLERQEGHPNVAPAGDMGVPQWATDVSRVFTDAERDQVFDAGVNVVGRYLNAPRNLTFRTLEREGVSEWVDLAHTRVDRAVRAAAFDVGRAMGHQVITRKTINRFGTLLRQRIMPLWEAGALFGDTADEAFRVEVDSVNDAESIAAREVNVEVGLKMSEHAEQVNVTIAKVPLTQEV
jgi:hypothetical protein